MLLGLRTGELTPADLPDQINELCWRRLMDFCQLAGFYRPFVLCFDQTEAYGHSPALARCFGTVIAQIHLLAANQMTVITANQQPWEETVARTMETADKDRFVPLPLEGINRAQAAELVRLRCEGVGVPADAVARFSRRRMADGQISHRTQPHGHPAILAGVQRALASAGRLVARTGRRIGRRRRLVRRPRPRSISFWIRYTDQIAAQPKRLGFNPDALRWLVEEAAAGRPEFKVIANPGNLRGYLPVVWVNASGEGQVFIGFEPGDNWKRWRTIMRDARDCCFPLPGADGGGE